MGFELLVATESQDKCAADKNKDTGIESWSKSLELIEPKQGLKTAFFILEIKIKNNILSLKIRVWDSGICQNISVEDYGLDHPQNI